MNENEEKLRVIAEDCKAVIEEAKSMGCNKVRALYNIPLENMELIVQALEKQIPKKPMISYDERVKENWCSCGVCAFGLGWKRTIHYKYCPNCGQELDLGNELIDTENFSKVMKDCFDDMITVVKQGGVSDDVCEWRKDGLFLHTSCGDRVNAYSDDFKYCPYCGKKIKVVE